MPKQFTPLTSKSLSEALNDKSLLWRAAMRVNRLILSEEESNRFSEKEKQQMVGGFSALFLEALHGEDSSVRTMVIETMIPGLIVSGQPAAGVIQWQATFQVAIAAELLGFLPKETHEEAMDWLCRFSGEYISEVTRAAVETAGKL